MELSDYRAIAKALYEIDTQWDQRTVVPAFDDLLQNVRWAYLEKAAYVVGCHELGRENPTPAAARVG